MTRIRQKRSILRARELVLSHIRGKGLPPDAELPPALALAEAAGVSFVTMLRALSELRARGVLSGVRGHPYRVSGVAGEGTPGSADKSPEAPLPAQATVWRVTRDRLTRDIVNGAFPPGSDLPSVKELRIRYDVSWAPLNKALRSLLSAGVIDRRRKRFSVPAFRAGSRHSRVVFLTHSFDSFTMYLAQHDEEIIKTLERLCAQANISLDVYLIFPESAESRDEHPRQLLRERRTGRVMEFEAVARMEGPAILGYLLVVPGPPGYTEERLLQLLSMTRTPCAVLGEAGGWALPREFARSGLMQLFTIASSSRPAHGIGTYLLSLGHRRIAYVSPYHHYPWSRARLEGLIEACAAAGPAASVTAFTEENEPRTAVAPSRVLDHIRDFAATLPPGGRKEYGALAGDIRERVAPYAQTREVLYGLLDRVVPGIGADGITALVAVNDHVACMALEYLAARRISVPGELSVVSFDDSFDALRMNLTSHNFNASGVATAMLGYLLRRQPYTGARTSTVLEIEGYIAERQTAAASPLPAAEAVRRPA